MNTPLAAAAEDPFALDQPQAYARWRERKLERYPRRVEDLVVEVRDPRNPRQSEIAAIQRIIGLANMAVYVSAFAGVADRQLPRRLGERLGLLRVAGNPFADEDGISALEATPEKSALGYIPYSNRRLLWHTDGYYNTQQQRIRAFILHCVHPATVGGENCLLDHEIAYILLRDANPDYVKALCRLDAMTIPPNDSAGMAPRPAVSGPVFATDGGALHMRYTARTRSIEWRTDETLRAALQFLNQILDAKSPYVFTLRLTGGQGLVCNNVLHGRSAFTNAEAPAPGRLVYRARYFDRVADGVATLGPFQQDNAGDE
ncbi:MAG: TauD/TfdA family dioxygenase [Casimicrobiaceae bacterium]